MLLKPQLVIEGYITSLSPITQGSPFRDEGAREEHSNYTYHRKMKVFYNGEMVEVPIVSANSVRGIMRRLGALSFLELLGIDKDQLEAQDKKLFYLLFSGGGLEKQESKSQEEKKADKELFKSATEKLREYIPLVSLLGCSFGQPIQGKLIVDNLVPIVKETAELLGEKAEVSARDIMGWMHYTRRDDTQIDFDKIGDKTEDHQQMIYNVQYIGANVKFKHGFALVNANEVETALFYHLLKRFMEIGSIGGQSSRGHGKIACEYNMSEKETDDTAYLNYVKENKDAILDFISTHWKVRV